MVVGFNPLAVRRESEEKMVKQLKSVKIQYCTYFN